MKLELCKHVMEDDQRREAFNALAMETFHLSFEHWYQSGAWKETNQPYTLFDGKKAVANVTVNQMDVRYEGVVRPYIQLGGVMTDPAYRHQGLSRRIMEEVKRDWVDSCKGMFLLANRSVTEFYPRFGFVEEDQYQYVSEGKVGKQPSAIEFSPEVRRLDLQRPQDRELLFRCYQKENPFSAFQVIKNQSLLEFYCQTVVGNWVYYLPTEDAVLIADCGEKGLECYDIYYDGDKSLVEILECFCKSFQPSITLLFTPVETEGFTAQLYEDEDTHLFVLEEKENVFRNAKLFVPEISHT